jgi:hypothetical protein
LSPIQKYKFIDIIFYSLSDGRVPLLENTAVESIG